MDTYPIITNNRVYYFALNVISDLMHEIRRVDSTIFDRIYVYDADVKNVETKVEIPKGTLTLLNNLESHDGFTKYEIGNEEEYIILPDDDPVEKYDSIQKKIRFAINNYKVTYYNILLALRNNFQNNIFYLNILKKPGILTKESNSLYPNFINSIFTLSEREYGRKLIELLECDFPGDIDVKRSYRIYQRVRFEAELIMKAVMHFNEFGTLEYADDEWLTSSKIKPKFQRKYDGGRPQMMIQYTIVFSKRKRDISLDESNYLRTLNLYLYSAIVVNYELGFDLFNAIELVGDERDTYNILDYATIMYDLFKMKKYGIRYIPHVGEVNRSGLKGDHDQEKYIIQQGLHRIGHGLTFFNPIVINMLPNESIFFEICPLSNHIMLKYIDNNPAKKYVGDNRIRLMICSDIGGFLGYSTVQADYDYIVTNWKVTKDQLIHLIQNGIKMVHPEFVGYYSRVLKHLVQSLPA